MFLDENPFQRDQLINIEQLIGRCLDHDVNLGDNHQQTIETYVQNGLVPKLLNGDFPATAVDRIVSIDKMLKEGKSLSQIKQVIEEQRQEFLRKPTDLRSLVDTYQKASKSLLMLSGLFFLIFLGAITLTITFNNSVTNNVVAKPVGNVLAALIREAKDENASSTDPLGLTNVGKVITINEKQEVTIQKTIISDPSAPISLENSLITNDSLTVESIDVKKILSKEITFPNLSGATEACVLTLDIAQLLSCSADLYWTAETIKDIADTSVSTGLAGLSLTGNGVNITRIGNAFALSLANEAISSIDGIKNNAGDIDFIAGAGVTITSNDSTNSITFNLAGSGVNADLLDSIDSAQFLRSDTTDNFTSGTLTLDAGTTLSVLGTFTCTSCVGDGAVSDSITIANTSSVSATALNSGTLGNGSVTLALGSFGSITGSLTDGNVADTITASNYLPLTGGTLAGNANFNNNLAINIGNAGTDFTAGGGLNLATDLDANGHGAFGSTAAITSSAIAYFSESQSADVIYSGLLVAPTSSFNGVGNPLTFGIRTLPIYSGADTSISLIGLDSISTYSGSGGATTLAAIQATVNTGAGSGSVATLVGVSIVSPSILGGTPANSYGIEIQDITVGTNIYPIYQSGTTGTNIFNAASNFGAKLSASTASTSAVGFNLNTAQAAPSCASLTNGDFGYDSTNNRIYWKGTGGTCSYWNRTGTFDIAERAVASEKLEAGDVLAIDTTATDLKVKKSSLPYQKTLIGIESTDPTFIDNPDALGNPQHIAKLALTGRVPTKVSTENGPVEVGDYLTSSSTPGVAMKATESGPVIGKSLQSFNQTGVGKVLVLVNSSYYTKPISGTTNSSISATEIVLGKNQIKLGASGKIEIIGDINLEGNLTISKTLFAQSVETTKLKITELSVDASGGSVGTAKIVSGTTKVIVPSNLVKSTSRVFVTALNFTSGQTLVVTEKQAGNYFMVEVEQPTTHDISFDWFIVN